MLTGGLAAGSCTGTTVVVDSTGAVQVNLAARKTIAIDAANKL
ncbi:MAG: hypothetical protein ACHQU8_05700 [Gemmatimonadales bacterium]